MKKTCVSQRQTDQEMASEYRFDYRKAKPNRFAEKMNLEVGWTVEKFVEEEESRKKKEKAAKPKKFSVPKKAKAPS